MNITQIGTGSTWSNIGTKVRGNDTTDVLRRAKLDYEVGLKPVALTDGTPIPGRMATVRLSDNHVYEVVSDKYNVIQNTEAFDFVRYMSDSLSFERAGETESGMVYLIAKMASVEILGDEFTPYAIFRNGFNSKIKISAAICPLRIVCQNQFNFAFKNSSNTVNVRHVANAEAKLAEAREVLRMSARYMETLNSEAEKYAVMHLGVSQVERVINALFPIPENTESMNPYALKRMTDNRSRFIAAYSNDDNANFRGRAWGLINAYTDFVTHNPAMGPTTSKFENKFATTVFAPDHMGRIIDVIQQAA